MADLSNYSIKLSFKYKFERSIYIFTIDSTNLIIIFDWKYNLNNIHFYQRKTGLSFIGLVNYLPAHFICLQVNDCRSLPKSMIIDAILI